MIVEGVFKARIPQSSKGHLLDTILPDLFERCRYIAKDKTLSIALRQFALETAMQLKPIAGRSFSDTTENNIMKLLFNATAIANVADNAASSPLTNLFAAGHTADPGESGTQNTNEVGYTSYARVTIARTSGGFTVTGNSVSPVAAITFPAGTGGSGTITFGSIGQSVSGAGIILMSGTVTPNIVCGNGITPSYPTSSAFTLD